jgi:hypothetical protein
MKLFKVSPDNYDYDNYTGIVVAAHNAKDAVKLCINKASQHSIHQITADDEFDYKPEIDDKPDITRFSIVGKHLNRTYLTNSRFSDDQSPFTVQEIDLQNITKSQKILASYNAG